MKVILLQSRASSAKSESRGQEIEVSDAEGARMIAAGQAKAVPSAKVQFVGGVG